MGAAGLTGILLPLHKSLLWNFPFLTSVFALLPLLAIYSVSAGTHWWVCSSDEYSCVDNVDMDFLVLFFLTSFI